MDTEHSYDDIMTALKAADAAGDKEAAAKLASMADNASKGRSFKPFDPTASGPSMGERVSAGVQRAGETLADVGTAAGAAIGEPLMGLAQMGERAFTGREDFTGPKLRQIEQEKQAALARSPLHAGLGYIGGMAAPAIAMGGTAAPSVAKTLATGGLWGASQPVTPGKEDTDYWIEKAKQASFSTGLGAGVKAAGALGGKALGQYVQPAEAQVQARTRADQLGFKTTPTMAAARTTDIVADRHNVDNMTKLATRETGEQTRNVSNEWIASRYKNIGQGYEDMFKGKTFTVDNRNIGKGLVEYKDLEAQMPANLRDTRVMKTVDSMLSDIAAYGGKPVAIDGTALHNMYKRLGDMASNPGASSEFRELANGIRSSITDIVEGQLGGDARREFQRLNRQWQATRAVESSRDPRTNKISGDKLGDFIDKQDRSATYGSDKLRDLGNIGQKLGIGSEGQRTRSYAQDVATKAGRLRQVASHLIPAKERMYQQYKSGMLPDLSSGRLVYGAGVAGGRLEGD